MKRRKFVKTTALATAASPMLWGTSKSWAGANDRVNVAVIGIRGMGQSHIRSYQNLNNVQVVALCDVDENLFPELGYPEYSSEFRKHTILFPAELPPAFPSTRRQGCIYRLRLQFFYAPRQ